MAVSWNHELNERMTKDHELNKSLEAKLKAVREQKSSLVAPNEPEIIYVGPRSFWDFLAEMERPKAMRVFGFVKILVSLAFFLGSIYLLAWYGKQEGGWEKGPNTFCIIAVGAVSLVAMTFSIGKTIESYME